MSTPYGEGLTPAGPGVTPPGQGLTPPGQGLTPPGQGLTPPGQGLTPADQGLTPPGRDLTPPGSGLMPSAAADTQALREEIASTRADLGETVQALAAKADVKARVRAGAHDVAVRADEFRQDLPVLAQQWSIRLGQRIRERPVPFAAALGAVVALVALLRWRRTR